MTSDQIRRLVLSEIGSEWSRTNLHGVSPANNLLEVPSRIKMVDATGQKELYGWVVLAESNVLTAGYGVVYSEPDEQFGLVQFVPGYQPCLLGIYGDFWSTFDAM